jgi:hypothetical protein
MLRLEAKEEFSYFSFFFAIAIITMNLHINSFPKFNIS